MIKINLSPHKKSQPSVGGTKFEIPPVLWMSFLGGLGALIIIYLIFWGITAGIENRVKKLTKISSQEKVVESTDASIDQLEQKVEYYQSLINELHDQQARWIYILDDLANRIRADMWLTSVKTESRKVSSPSKASPVSQDENANSKSRLVIALEGESYNKLTIADFLAELENSGIFKNIQLQNLNAVRAVENHQRKHINFKISMEYQDFEMKAGQIL